MTQKILVAAVALMVSRDAMTKLPVTVPAHEVEVMTALHGAENVVRLDEKSEPVEIDPEFEAERLEQKYGQGLIRELFGAAAGAKVARLAAEHAVGGEGGESDPASMTKAQLLEAAKSKGLQVDASMTKAQLLEAAKSKGLQVDASMNKAALIAALNEAVDA